MKNFTHTGKARKRFTAAGDAIWQLSFSGKGSARKLTEPLHVYADIVFVVVIALGKNSAFLIYSHTHLFLKITAQIAVNIYLLGVRRGV